MPISQLRKRRPRNSDNGHSSRYRHLSGVAHGLLAQEAVALLVVQFELHLSHCRVQESEEPSAHAWRAPADGAVEDTYVPSGTVSRARPTCRAGGGGLGAGATGEAGAGAIAACWAWSLMSPTGAAAA
eukprot:7761970-Heterocapsa_arctica.AAC.1